MSDTADYVAGYLREADRERYLSTLFVPAPARPAVQSLLAFAADIASIPARVREPAAGEIRLQWWVDALEGDGHGEVRQNPLAAALLDAMSAARIPTGALVRLVRARRFDLYHDPMPDMASFEGYAGETESVLFQLAAMLLNGGEELPGDAAGHFGVARGLVGHLRAFGYNASRGRIFLPLNVFAANGVADAVILGGQEQPELRAALGQIGDMVLEHLTKGELALAELPRVTRSAFAVTAILQPQLALLRRHGKPFAVSPDLSDWRKLLAMGWWQLRKG
jgi:15-cis-phytoene synthase